VRKVTGYGAGGVFHSTLQKGNVLVAKNIITVPFTLLSSSGVYHSAIANGPIILSTQSPVLPLSSSSVVSKYSAPLQQNPPVSAVNSLQTRWTYKSIHPITGTPMQGLRGNPDRVSRSTTMSRFDYLSQVEHDVVSLVFNSVKPNSQASYDSAQKAWFRYVIIVGTNPTMSMIPKEWFQMAAVRAHPHPFNITVLAGFLTYCTNDNGGKPTCCSSAINYLSAVRKYQIDCGLDVHYYDTSAVLKAARKGLTNEWIGLPGHMKIDTTSIPVSPDMLDLSRVQLLVIEVDIFHKAVWTISIVSVDKICRTSEIIWCPKTDHHIKTEKLVFILMPDGSASLVWNGNQWKDIPRNALLVCASIIWNYPKSRICGHYLTIVDSKNDPFGVGSKYPSLRVVRQLPDSVYELTNTLYDWCVAAKPAVGEQLFSSTVYPNLVIVRSHMEQWLAKVADFFDLPLSRVNMHSLRYTGASIMHANNFSDSTIMRMGRWNSLAFLRYIELSLNTYMKISSAMNDRRSLTIEDVRLLHPAI